MQGTRSKAAAMEDGEDADDDVHLNLGHRGARSRRAGSVAEDLDINVSFALV